MTNVRFRNRSRVLAAVVIGALISSATFATTWIVDASNGPGTNFTTITAALAVAQPGDHIVVRSGIYGEAVTVTKGVTIVGWNATTYPLTVPANPYTAAIWGGILVTNLPAGQRCIISGLNVARPSSAGGTTVGLLNCQGVVVLDRVVIPNGGLYIENCTDVFLESVWIRHVAGAVPPASGVVILNSWVQANDLDATGGDLGGEPAYFAAAGAALEAHANSVVALARPKLLGGFGGGPWNTTPSTPAGGPALIVVMSIVAIVDDVGSSSYVVGGQGGHRGSTSALSIPSGNGGNAVEAHAAGFILNKKPLPVVPGLSGPNKSGGPLGSPGAPSVTSSGGFYAPVADTPSVYRNGGATVSGGFWILSHHAAGPGYPVAMAVMQEFDLNIYPPSVQFAGGNPFTALALAVGTSNGAGYFEFAFGLPFGIPIQVAGTALIVQTADDVANTLFLSNPGTWVLGF